MLLSDRSIRELCVPDKFGNIPPNPMLTPFSEGKQDGVISYGLCSAGYDLRLGNKLLIFKNSYNEVINPKKFKDSNYLKRVFDEVLPNEDGVYILPSGPSYALGFSVEHIHIPRTLKGRCVGKSTYARCGVLVNTTPLEPGWKGHLTIEISNISPCPVMIFANEGIAQLEFEILNFVPECDYESKGGKYNNQGPEPIAARVKDHIPKKDQDNDPPCEKYTFKCKECGTDVTTLMNDKERRYGGCPCGSFDIEANAAV